jgi:hypothetical protein
LEFKNRHEQLEKHYCSLIKQIIKGIINLEELGDVDNMNVRTLLEVGAQKTMEHRMNVRNLQSNEKKVKENENKKQKLEK